jgi:hypothetical protein
VDALNAYDEPEEKPVASHTQSSQSRFSKGKYPPAEPGALGCEPLKAAEGPLRGPALRANTIACHLTDSSHPFLSVRTSSSPLTPLQPSGASQSASGQHGGSPAPILQPLLRNGPSAIATGAILPKMSNFCCLPGRAGGPPLVASQSAKSRFCELESPKRPLATSPSRPISAVHPSRNTVTGMTATPSIAEVRYSLGDLPQLDRTGHWRCPDIRRSRLAALFDTALHNLIGQHDVLLTSRPPAS